MTSPDNPEVPGTTPLDDYSGLKKDWIQTRPQLDAAEAANILQAMGKFLGKKKYPFPRWFTVKHLNAVHKEMFGKVWTWAGLYRKTDKSIGISPYRIPVEMGNLEKDLLFFSQKESQFDPIEISARTHHRLVWIHPYENGNGRHARLIGDMILSFYGYRYPQWPHLISNGEEREQYLRTLREADNGNFSSLMRCLIKYGARAR